MSAPTGVSGTKRTMPVISAPAPRRRKRLVNLSSGRGANQGAPSSATLGIYPFPFQDLWQPSRHGHYPVFGVGLARRLGAWRGAGTGTLGGRHNQRGL